MAFSIQPYGPRFPGLVPGNTPIAYADQPTRAQIEFLNSMAGLFDFGFVYPYNRGSTTDTTISGATNITQYINTYRTLTINATLTCTVSPVFLFAKTLTIGASGIIDADGVGGAGGAGGLITGAGSNGTAGGRGNQASSDVGLSTGGGGGAGAGSTFKNGGAGGATGTGLIYSLAGGAGGSSAGGVGTAGGNKVRIPILGQFVNLSISHIGGAGGGGGGAGSNVGVGTAAGGLGGNGGGIVVICCEQYTNSGTIRARGTAGAAGDQDLSTHTYGGGGGGGGSGGMILVLSLLSNTSGGGTMLVTGGAGGSGTEGGGNGAAGGDGYAYYDTAA